MKLRYKILIVVGVLMLIPFILFWFWSGSVVDELLEKYESRESLAIRDRHNEIIHISKNEDDFFVFYEDDFSDELESAIIEKEDKYFYYHFGVNPVSTFRAVWDLALNNETRASSTITQQLVKILLDHEFERTVENKIEEMFYSMALEARLSKAEILNMYMNSVFMGNQVQGMEMASRYYFNRTPEQLDSDQRNQLVATLSSPSQSNPFVKKENEENVAAFNQLVSQDTYFEFNGLPRTCESCKTTLDSQLIKKIREIVEERIIDLSEKDVQHAAVVVITYPENELLAIVGSPDPHSEMPGDQINMAVQPRPIGSTVKPFLYGKGFSEGLRPYTLVDDKEYRYTTALGFAHYPKNFDYTYQGIVTLHKSLANSLNVPSVKVLEYIGLNDFYDFLLEDLQIEPVQPLENYQFGIALGHLEMSLLDLSHRFTIFAQEGMLKPLKISDVGVEANLVLDEEAHVLDEKYIQLVNKIISDRETGSDQFGIVGNLHLPSKNYAVKTGTSREFHDSWTIGYTPDFLVGVWVGNANNTPMQEVTGQEGAGAIWNDVMTLMLNSEYNHDSEFEFDEIETFRNGSLKNNGDSIEFGLVEDDYDSYRNLLIEEVLIKFPHNEDEFLFEEGIELPLESETDVEWFVDGDFIGSGEKVNFKPTRPGRYEVKAQTEDDLESIIIIMTEN